MDAKNILVWLPWPMGDAIMSTPALRSIRDYFKGDKIFFLAKPAVREILSPCAFADEWILCEGHNVFSIAAKLRKHKFTHAILLKNSFTPALAVFLARIPCRLGYNRHHRGFLLTEKLNGGRNTNGSFKPGPMIDYYLAAASWLGAETSNRKTELAVDERSKETLLNRFPLLASKNGPTVIFVPGGAYGSSKCWPSERFAQTAERLIKKYDANIFISVAPVPAERQIARQICRHTKNNLINLANRPVSLSELKALFTGAELIITNDTGPRHIGLALDKKTISLFGPNNPEWTRCESKNEIQLVADVQCAGCDKGKCPLSRRICMESITSEMVCKAAEKLLEKK